MSNNSSPPSSPAPAHVPQEIKVISHSSLFYWWPVWFFGFVFALWTYVENYRLAILSHESKIVRIKDKDNKDVVAIQVEGNSHALLDNAQESKEDHSVLTPKIRVTEHTWMGPLFLVILFLVIMITNVPLRGLWSMVMIMLILVIALVLALLDKWGVVLKASGDLHVFMNMAGYLALSTGLFIAWVLAVFFFDRRTYMIVKPHMITVCEEVGGGVHAYGAMGLALEKRRDDWFRHLILGFGTGDLIVKTAGAERHEIRLPNVILIGSKIHMIEKLLAMQPVVRG